MQDAAVPVRAERLRKSFARHGEGSLAAVDDVDIVVAPGEFLTLLGPSGCGKTTTLRMIAGFEEPDHGRVLIGDEDVTELPIYRRNIGFVFQSYALFPHLRVFDNIAYSLRVKRLARAEVGRRVDDALQMVGLGGYGSRYPNQLSGGEQQRVAVARAVVMQPRVLLFDEPLSNLDAKLRVQMRLELRRLQQELRTTTIYVTHDQEEAMAISDRIVVMERGRVVQAGTAEEIYYDPSCDFVARFIGRINAIAGVVADASADAVEVEALGVRLRARADRSRPIGTPVTVLARPEAVVIAGASESGIRGVIKERIFLGEKIEYLVDAGGLTVQAAVYKPMGMKPFNVGEPVTLDFDDKQLRVVDAAVAAE